MTVLGALGYSILGIATAGAARTDKAADAVTGQGIIIIREITLVGATSDYLTLYNSTESTKAYTSFRNFALVQTKMAGNPRLSSGRIFRQTVGLSGAGVNLLDLRPNFLKVGPYTICTEAYYL